MARRAGSNYETCPKCRGKGEIECPTCHGTGKVKYSDRFLDETFRCDNCGGYCMVECPFPDCEEGYIIRL